MQIIIAYLMVVIVWSTTPLAITLSNDSLSPHAAVMSRMILALCIVALLVSVFKPQSVLKAKNWKIYAAAGFGMFPCMPLVYFAAEYISSGLIAVVFALNPIFASALATYILREPPLSMKKIAAIFVSLLGLVIVFYAQLNLDVQAWVGIALILLSTLAFSLSQVLVKYFQKDQKTDAMEQTLGALLISAPGFLIAWYVLSDQPILPISNTSLYAVLYLAVIGSVFGFVAYFYVLTHLSVVVVSMIPLITPVLALLLGAFVLDEVVTRTMMLGVFFVLFGLVLYGDSFKFVSNRIKRIVRM